MVDQGWVKLTGGVTCARGKCKTDHGLTLALALVTQPRRGGTVRGPPIKRVPLLGSGLWGLRSLRA